MSSINLNVSDAILKQKLQEFKNGMEAYGKDLGFSTTAQDEASTASSTFDASLALSRVAISMARGAVAAKDNNRKSSIATIRALAAQVKANPQSTPEVLAAFGLNPLPKRSGVVSTPTQLTASPQSQGYCKLTWRRNGNVSGTVFVIQAKTATGDWVMIGTATRVKFTDLDAAPGRPKWYRVRAERAGNVSAYTNEVSIYSAEESTTDLKAA